MYNNDYIKFFFFKNQEIIKEEKLNNDILDYILKYLILFFIKSTVICCSNYSFLLDNNKIYVTGSNEYGQLGLGEYKYNNYERIDNINCIKHFKKNEFFKDEIILSISLGHDYVIILTNKGVYSMGSSHEGQLGTGYSGNMNVYLPEKIKFFNNKEIKNISCGGSHNIIITKNNKIYVFGCNHQGQLGLGDDNNRYNPVEIFLSSSIVVSASCGDVHSLILTSDGLYGAGGNSKGQLGLGFYSKKYNYNFTKLKFFDNMEIMEIYCGLYYSIVLLKNNELYGMGDNEYYKLGIDEDISNIINPTKIKFDHKVLSLYCGYKNTFILSDEGCLYFTGCDDNIKGNYAFSKVFIKINFFDKMKIISIGIGLNHILVLTETGLYGKGNTKYGQLGISNLEKIDDYSLIPI